jgi:hydrogenase maturation protease
MSWETGPFVVLGVGNILLRDDGVGVHVVRELERQVARGDAFLPPGTRLVDGGTLGLDLLPLIAGARAVLLVDAAVLGNAPGSVVVRRADALLARRDGPRAVLPAGIDDLLAAAQLADMLPTAVSLVGVEPGEITSGLDLTEAVRAALPAAVARAIGELWRIERVAATPPPAHRRLGHVAAGSAG